jgi:hypothetical protein
MTLTRKFPITNAFIEEVTDAPAAESIFDNPI